MSTVQTRTAALELAVDLACAQAEGLGVDTTPETVIARARKFDDYLAGTPTTPRTGLGVPHSVPCDAFDVAREQVAGRRVTPGDLYASGRRDR